MGPSRKKRRPERRAGVGTGRDALRTAGTRIRLALPLGGDARCDDRDVALSVLIVDDDPGFLGLTARILVELGAAPVLTASSAAGALEVVRAARPDAVLVDIGLPDRHGIDLAYELAELPWRPRVVLTSSDRDAILALDPQDGPQFRFLDKEELGSDTLQHALLER